MRLELSAQRIVDLNEIIFKMAAIQHVTWSQRELPKFEILKKFQSKSFTSGENNEILRESRRVSIEENDDFFQLNQYKLMDTIGQGSYGVVKLGYNVENNTNYAIKILNKKKLIKKSMIFARLPPKKKLKSNPISNEIAILKKLNHRNVVKLHEILDDPNENFLYLAFEFCEFGQILEIPTLRPLGEDLARSYFRDVICGLEYLHFQKIIHRDLKPANLLLSKDGVVKIADLGVCTEFEGSDAILSGSVGTPAFAPPETVGGDNSKFGGKAADIWSLGITLYSLVYGNVPFYDENPVILYEKIRKNPVIYPKLPLITVDLIDLINSMLIKNPGLRVKLPEIKRHKWVTNNGKLPELPLNYHENIEITLEDLNSSVTTLPKLDTLILIKHMLKKHSFQNPFAQKLKDAQRRTLYGHNGRMNSAPDN